MQPRKKAGRLNNHQIPQQTFFIKKCRKITIFQLQKFNNFTCYIFPYSNVRYGLYYSLRYFFIGCVGGQLDLYYKDGIFNLQARQQI